MKTATVSPTDPPIQPYGIIDMDMKSRLHISAENPASSMFSGVGVLDLGIMGFILVDNYPSRYDLISQWNGSYGVIVDE